MTKLITLLYGLSTLVLLIGCYSFKGISIPTAVDTFYVENFSITIANAPAAIEVTIAEELRKKIREGSRLQSTDVDPDVEFIGTITQYGVDNAGATSGNTDAAALNKLKINITIEYIDNLDDENSKKKTYSPFTTFDSSIDLQDVEDDLVKILVDEVTEQIFNDTFTDW